MRAYIAEGRGQKAEDRRQRAEDTGQTHETKINMSQGNLYTTPGATRHPLLKKGAWEAPFLGTTLAPYLLKNT